MAKRDKVRSFNIPITDSFRQRLRIIAAKDGKVLASYAREVLERHVDRIERAESNAKEANHG